MGERGDEKTAWGAAIGEINVERGAESGLVKENVELRKLVAILVLYEAVVLSRCRNLSGTETILSYVKLTFKSTRGTDTIRKLAETDPKSALRLPKWATITMAKEKR